MTYPTIYFLRHGETEWNRERRIQGQLESVLTEKGVAHAHTQARLIKPILDAGLQCFVSPLKRAMQTAEIALHGHDMTVDERLMEIHVGDWQGELRDNIVGNKTLPILDLYASAPNGEGFDRFEARIKSFLDDLAGPSVIVAHGMWGQVMRGLIQGRPRAEMSGLSNHQGCIYVLENGQERLIM